MGICGYVMGFDLLIFFSFCIVLCFRYTTNFTAFFIAFEVAGCDWFKIKVMSVMLPCENYVPLRCREENCEICCIFRFVYGNRLKNLLKKN